MLVYIQSIIAIGIGIVSSITDFKEKKIYNKYILMAVGLSLLTYIIFYKEIEFYYLGNYLLNLVITALISFLFFYFKIWAAGDAKLFLAVIMMIPYQLYEVEIKNIFPAIYILIIIFSIAFFYVVVETVFLWVRDKERFEKIKISNLKKENVKRFVLQYFMGYFIILFINNIIFNFFVGFRLNNGGLVLLCNMLILLFIYRIINQEKTTIIIIFMFSILNILYYSIFGINVYSLDFKMLILVIIIILFRTISEKYNYKEIKIDDLKERMILSFGSVLKFYTSKVRGLPKTTTETTDSRLSQEEVDSIMRWSKTKKGEETITIVRHMPFAPFICLGEIVFFILKLYS